jgi:tetratricopeptide (TPR) repeat protein
MTANSAHQSVGERGIGIQNVGDNITVIVYAGRAELSLLRKHARKAEPTTELQLLRVDLRATTLVGRDAERAALQAWLTSDRPVTVRCLTGRAGAGKTRLAIELCEQAEKAGWTAGFVESNQFTEFVKLAAEWRWKTDMLVVVDYAAAFARDLRAWLEILARPESQSSGKRLRLLLLERHAERDLGWWAELMRPVSFSDPGPDELADPPEPVPLPSLSTVGDRRAVLAETMRLVGEIAGIQPIPQPPLPDANADFDRRLADDTINNEPLYLMMAGAEAIWTGAPAALTLSRIDLAQRAAARERQRLHRLALQWGVPEKLVAHLAMCVTLQGGCSAEEGRRLVDEERRAKGFPETVPATEIVNRLAEALPTPGEAGVDAVRPDLIGEAFLLQEMEEHRRFPRIQTEIVERAWRRADNKVATALIRTAQDYAQGEPAHCSVKWLHHLIDQPDDPFQLMALANALPSQTLALRDVGLLVSQRIYAVVVERVAREPYLQPLLALSLNNLAYRLSDLGRREPALEAAEEAVDIRRELAARWPDMFRPDLAFSLNNLANRLSDLGQREPALAAAEEATALYRELAARRQDAFRPDLGLSLNNLANMLSSAGQREKALATAKEAVMIRRELVAALPGSFRPDLASSLHNLAAMFSNLGRREPALEAAEEAMALYRELAAQRSDAFLPDLARSLKTSLSCGAISGGASRHWRRRPRRRPFAVSWRRSSRRHSCLISPCRSTTSPPC